MRGLMMDHPLLISSLLEYAALYHGPTELVSRTSEGPIHRTTYAAAEARSRRLAQALGRLGVEPGDRLATLAWNGFRHFEVYFATSGMGAICHTVNPRLFEEQLIYILNHAEDRLIFVDLPFMPLLEGLHGRLDSLRQIVVMTDREHMPETSLPGILCYEDLLAAEDGDYRWPELEETTASSLCYTSGTTGNPKGVLYSHRSTVLHTFGVCMTDSMGISSRDAALPVVPMFHANAWGMPYAGAMAGCKLVFPGPRLDGESVYQLLEEEGVTLAAGVPTVWLMLLDHLRRSEQTFSTLERVVIGGSAAPRAMIEAFQGHRVEVIHAWGMTETSPLGCINTPTRATRDLSAAERLDLAVKQGRGVYGVEMRVVDDDGRERPRDGETFGELQVRGPWVTSGYFKGEGGAVVDAGWFATGDVATLDPEGYMQITDRAKDVIKSGGEWISSIDLENAAMALPAVAEAAVIGVAHPKWDERPLLVIVAAEGGTPSREEILRGLEGKVVRWWLPDDVVFVDELPHTATGKVSKRILRQRFADYRLPGI